MAGYQPSEDEIVMFMECAPGIDRREVIARIKGNNNDVQNAILEYFENPGNGSKYQWMDGHFGDGRDGEYMSNSIPSFNIHSPDEMPYEVREPQTRPPSRNANNRSPMSSVIDLSHEHANADPRTSISHDDDSALRRAIEESRAEAGLPPQQTGITSTVTQTQTVHFGPATRNEYEEKSWSMVSVGKAQEIIPDPEPATRKRDLNVPAFLKPSVENNRLNALLTIYYEIPLLREIFMNRTEVQANYGHDDEWWTGRTIEVPYMTGSEPDDGQEMLYEIQRLMAFLDKTDRSYGSVHALANCNTIKRQQRLSQGGGRDLDLETLFWQTWNAIFKSRETGHVGKIFSVGVDSEERESVQHFAILALELPPKTSDQETLYDVADEILWPSNVTNPAEAAYLEHTAEIFTFRVSEREPSSPMDVPAVWYPDRYMASSKQAALEMRVRKAEIIEQIRNITSLEESLTETVVRGKIIKVQDLFKAALQHDAGQVDGEEYAGPNEDSLSEEATYSRTSTEKAAKLSSELNKIMASIDKKLEALNLQREKARDNLRQVSKLYTEPSSDSNEASLHKYTLRGVSTTKSTMYIRRKAEIDLIDIKSGSETSVPNEDQWWKITYVSAGSNPMTVEKKTEEEVLQAAKTESKDTLLVYASEKAMQFESKPLPNPLEKFVRDDNRLFEAELSKENDTEVHITSPGKRKWEGRTEDLQESARWEGGTSPKGYETSAQIMERELPSTDGASGISSTHTASQALADQTDDSRTVTPDEDEHEIIFGVDPKQEDHSFSGQEMQERVNMPMLSASSTRDNTIDSMDLDPVLEDEHGAKESAAGRNLGVE